MLGKKLKFYISPYYITRKSKLEDIKYIARKYQPKGKLIDIGCGTKPYENIFKECEYKGIDFKDYSRNKDFIESRPDYYFDEEYIKNSKLPFKDESFNNVVSFQVLEHHAEPTKLISEISRILKVDGLLILSWPFMGGLHEVPHDYGRPTQYWVEKELKAKGLKIIELKKEGSVFSTIAMLLNEELNSFASKSRLRYIIATVLYPLFFVNSRVSLILDRIYKSDTIFYNYILVAKKAQ